MVKRTGGGTAVQPAPKPVVPKPVAPKPVVPKAAAPAPKATSPKPQGAKPQGNGGAKGTGAKGTGAKGTGAKGTGAKGTGPKGTGGKGQAGGAPATGVVDTGAVDTGAVSDTGSTDATAAQTQTNITNAALGRVAERDPLLQQEYTQGIGKLGFGFGKAGASGLTSFQDLFGAFAPGGAPNTAGLTIRDALGREVSAANAQNILGSDVYAPGGAAQNIAGTDIGEAILAARRAAAAGAEARSAGGLSTAGGLRSAAGEEEKVGREKAITSLLSSLTGLTSGISGKRQDAYTTALGEITGENIGGYVPPAAKPSPSPAAAASAGAAPSGKPQMTPGPSGTFRAATDKILSSGTPKQKIAKLTALLNTKNLTPAQASAIRQMISKQKKKV